MLAITIFLLILCSGSFLGTVCFNRRFEEVLPLTAIGSVLSVFVFGVCGALEVGVTFCIIAVIVLYITSAILLFVRRNFKDFLKNFFTPGFVIFLPAFGLLAFYNRGRLACTRTKIITSCGTTPVQAHSTQQESKKAYRF